MGISASKKNEIMYELLEQELIKKRYYKSKKEYIFYSRELKHMLYHELGKNEKELLHREAGDIIIKYVNFGKKYILEEMIYQLSKTNRNKIALETILNKAIEYKKKHRADSQYLWELAYSIVSSNKDYEKDYNSLYILKKLVEIYFSKGKEVDIEFHIEELKKIARMQNNIYYKIKSKYFEVDYLFLKNQLKEADPILKSMYKLAARHNLYSGEIMTLYLISKQAFYRNDWYVLVDAAENLIRLSHEKNFDKFLPGIYNILGAYNKHKGNHRESIDNFQRSISYYKASDNILEIIKPINNIGGVYFEHYKDTEKALGYFKEGYELAKEHNLTYGLALFSLNLGEIYIEKLNIEKSLDYTKKSKEISLSRDDFRMTMMATINLIKIYLYRDDIKIVFDNFADLKKLVKENVMSTQLEVEYHSLLAKMYGCFGNMNKALKNIKLVKTIYIDYNQKEYNKSILNEVYFRGHLNRKISTEDKNIVFNILKNYKKENISNEALLIILEISQLSVVNREIEFTKSLIEIYKKLMPSEEIEEIEIFRKSIENVIDFDSEILKELETADINKYSLNIRFGLHYNLFINLRDKGKYKKAIYHLLKYFGNLMYVVDHIENIKLKKQYLESRKSDFIKKEVSRLIKLEFGKNINSTKLECINSKNINKYFSINEIVVSLKEDEIDSIFYSYYDKNEIKDLWELISSMGEDFQNNLDMILDYICRDTLAEKGFIVLHDNDTNNYEVVASCGKKSMEKFDLNRLVYLDREKEGIFVNKNLMDLNGNLFDFLPRENMGFLGAPIGYNNENADKELRKNTNVNYGKHKGYIYLETESYINKFNFENFKKIKSLAKLIDLIIENHKLKDISSRDRLTNAMTRKYFDISLEKFLNENFKKEVEFSLLMIDLDDFKGINDNYGHLMGDKVLREIAQKLKENIRMTDLLCRYGGDEFTIALLDTSLNEGINIAEKIRNRVEKSKVAGIGRGLTITVGVSHYPSHGKYKKELMKRGDEALYFAKEKLGKNSVASWDHISSKSDEIGSSGSQIAGRYMVDENMASTILKTTNLIEEKISIEEKGSIFLDILIKSLNAKETHLVFIEGSKIASSIVKIKNLKDSKSAKYKLNIIYKALSTRKPEYFIDWENYDGINPLSGMPNWNSIIYIPLIKKGNIKGIVYLSVPIREKEFNSNDFNLAKLLSNIFLANF